MKPLNILYLGRNSGTSLHRAMALRRLGHEVFVMDPALFLSKQRLIDIWTWHTGALFLENYIRGKVISALPNTKYNLVHVDCGELVGPSLVRELKRRFGTVVNYNIDDPFGQRDGKRWRLYLAALADYSCVIVVRDCNIPEAYAAGARKVLRVHRSADEIAHNPRLLAEDEVQRWESDVSFIGTWMPERGPFMAKLIEFGVPLRIYGDRWQRAPEWNVLRDHWRGPGLYDDNYAKAIQCTKVSLGLLSKGNRDLTTTRSFEVPYLAGVLCAERTREHMSLYTEDEEAVFWSVPEECAAKCMRLLQDEPHRKRIAQQGRMRCIKNKTTNEAVMAQILSKTLVDDLPGAESWDSYSLSYRAAAARIT